MAKTKPQPHDAAALLMEQHQHVRNLCDSISMSPTSERAGQFDVLVHLLAVHEVAEEEIIYPAVRARVPNGAELVRARNSEEARAKKLLVELETMGTTSPDFDSCFGEFRGVLMEHAAAEEREIFPAVREHVPSALQRPMRGAVIAAEAFAPTHAHSFSPQGATANLVTGPVVAVVDRVRDAIHAVRS